MTNEQSATLLRLNKQEQVKALQSVGFTDITENTRASEFPNRIKWAAGLLDLCLACNRILDNSKWYFTSAEWASLSVANKLKFIKRGLRIRANGRSFVIAAQECYNSDFTTSFYWGGTGVTFDGLTQKGLGTMYNCFTGEEDSDLIITALKDKNVGGVIGAPAAEAARAYRAYTLESDGIEDDSCWYLPSSGQMLLMYRYRDQINEMMRTFWSSDSILMTDKYYWSSTIWDTNSSWTFELNTGRINNQGRNANLLHVRAVASE
jgi:hypothetical protein|nr:MAG TPA: Protein of unknown function (DUF1566) [Caudoviricetes sp.]